MKSCADLVYRSQKTKYGGGSNKGKSPSTDDKPASKAIEYAWCEQFVLDVPEKKDNPSKPGNKTKEPVGLLHVLISRLDQTRKVTQILVCQYRSIQKRDHHGTVWLPPLPVQWCLPVFKDEKHVDDFLDLIEIGEEPLNPFSEKGLRVKIADMKIHHESKLGIFGLHVWHLPQTYNESNKPRVIHAVINDPETKLCLSLEKKAREQNAWERPTKFEWVDADPCSSVYRSLQSEEQALVDLMHPFCKCGRRILDRTDESHDDELSNTPGGSRRKQSQGELKSDHVESVELKAFRCKYYENYCMAVLVAAPLAAEDKPKQSAEPATDIHGDQPGAQAAKGTKAGQTLQSESTAFSNSVPVSGPPVEIPKEVDAKLEAKIKTGIPVENFKCKMRIRFEGQRHVCTGVRGNIAKKEDAKMLCKELFNGSDPCPHIGIWEQDPRNVGSAQKAEDENAITASCCCVDSNEESIEMSNSHSSIWKPKAIISVTGGADNFELVKNDRKRNRRQVDDIFTRGIIRTALTMDAMIVDGGSASGVMQEVGKAVVRDGNRVPTLGIIPWGAVVRRDQLEWNSQNSKEGKSASTTYAYFPEYEKSTHGARIDCNHRYFIFVDSGFSGKQAWGTEIDLQIHQSGVIGRSREKHGRYQIECVLSEREKGRSIPHVLVVVNGGVGTMGTVYSLANAYMSENEEKVPEQGKNTATSENAGSQVVSSEDIIVDLPCTGSKKSVPVVVVEGSGLAADMIAYVWRHFYGTSLKGDDKPGERRCQFPDDDTYCTVCSSYPADVNEVAPTCKCKYLSEGYKRIMKVRKEDLQERGELSDKHERNLRLVIAICRRKEAVTVFNLNDSPHSLEYAIMKSICRGTLQDVKQDDSTAVEKSNVVESKEGQPLSVIQQLRFVMQWEDAAAIEMARHEIFLGQNVDIHKYRSKWTDVSQFWNKQASNEKVEKDESFLPLKKNEIDKLLLSPATMDSLQFLLAKALSENRIRFVELMLAYDVRLPTLFLHSMYDEYCTWDQDEEESEEDGQVESYRGNAVNMRVLHFIHKMIAPRSFSDCTNNKEVHYQQKEQSSGDQHSAVQKEQSVSNMLSPSQKEQSLKDSLYALQEQQLLGDRLLQAAFKWEKFAFSKETTGAPQKKDLPNVDREDIFLWALMTGRLKAAELLWREGEKSMRHNGLTRALFACVVARMIGKKLPDDERRLFMHNHGVPAGEEQDGENISRHFENIATEILEKCWNRSQVHTITILTLPLIGLTGTVWIDKANGWFGRNLFLTPITLAHDAKATHFVAHEAFQDCLDCIWYGRLLKDGILHGSETASVAQERRRNPCGFRINHVGLLQSPLQLIPNGHGGLFKIIDLVISAFLFIPILRSGRMFYNNKTPESRVSIWYKKALAFYTAPCTKFGLAFASYLTFVILYTYIGCYMDYEYTVIEAIVHTWIVAIFLGEFRDMLIVGRIRYLRHMNNYLDLAMLVAYLPAAALRIFERYFYTKNDFDNVGGLPGANGTTLELQPGTVALYNVAGSEFGKARSWHGLAGILFWVRLIDYCRVSRRLGPLILVLLEVSWDAFQFFVILLVFMLSFGAAILCAARPRYDPALGFAAFMEQAVFIPYMEVFGEHFLNGYTETWSFTSNPAAAYYDCEEGDLACRNKQKLGIILLAVYLFISGIILMNLLIAKMNSSYDEVLARSTRTWKFQRLELVLEFSRSLRLHPDPISILHSVYIIGKRICKAITYYCLRSGPNASDCGDKTMQKPQRAGGGRELKEYSTQSKEERGHPKIQAENNDREPKDRFAPESLKSLLETEGVHGWGHFYKNDSCMQFIHEEVFMEPHFIKFQFKSDSAEKAERAEYMRKCWNLVTEMSAKVAYKLEHNAAHRGHEDESYFREGFADPDADAATLEQLHDMHKKTTEKLDRIIQTLEPKGVDSDTRTSNHDNTTSLLA